MYFVKHLGKYFLAIIPIFLFLGYYFSFRSPSPIVDDFWYFVDFEVLVRQSSFIEKVKLLFIVRNSHICIPSYFLGLLQVLTFKQLDTGLMTSIGLLFLFFTIAIFYRAIHCTIRSKSSLPLLFVSLTPQIYSIIFFPLVSLQVCITFFFVVACSYIVAYKPFAKKNFSWALFLALLITFSNGNGMVIWPMGAILLILQGKPLRKQLLSWTTVGVLSIGIYLILFSTEKSQFDNFAITPLYFFKVLIFNLSFLGNALDFFPSLIFTESSGFGLLKKILLVFRVFLIIGFTVSVLLIYTKKIYAYFKKQRTLSNTTLFTLGLILFIIGSGFIGGIFRANEGYGIAVSARYKYYGMIGLLSIIVYANHVLSSKQYKVVLWLSVVYFIGSYVCYWSIGRNFTNQANASLMNINAGQYTYIHQPYGVDWNNSLNKDIITRIKQYQLFDFKKAEHKLGLNSNTNCIDQPLSVTYLDKKLRLNDITLLQKIQYDFIIRLKSSENEIINIPLNSLPLIDYKTLQHNLYSYSDIYNEYIPNGTYEMFLVSKIINSFNQQKLKFSLVKSEGQIRIIGTE